MSLNQRGRRDIFPYLLVAPAILFILIFTFYPVAKTFYLSTQHYVLTDLKNQHYIGFDLFKRAFHDEDFFRCLRFSLVWVAFSVSLQFASGLIMALLLNESFTGRGVYRAVILCPWVLSGVVVGLIWSWMFNAEAGVFNEILMNWGITDTRVAWFDSKFPAMCAVIIANVWRGMPFFAVTMLAALQTIPPELYEAVEVDGGGPVAKFRFVTLPMITDMIAVTVLLRSIWTFNNVDLIFTMTAGGPAESTQTLATYIFTRAWNAMDYGYGAALAVILFFILIGSIAIVFKAQQATKPIEEN